MPSSIDFLSSLFPSLSTALPTSLLSVVFPPSTALNCPTPTLALTSTLTISWPNLLPLCLLGALIGLHGFSSLLSTRPLYATSFSYFGLMNIAAFLAHCVFPERSEKWEVAYAVDMVATSTASFFLILAVLRESLDFKVSFVPSIVQTMYFPNAFLLQMLELRLNPSGGWWIAESLYIGVTAAAGIVVFLGLVLPALEQSPFSSKFLSLSVVLLGVGIFVAAPVLDAELCRYVPSPFGNLLTPAFLGCDVAFLGLYLYVRCEGSEKDGEKGKAKAEEKKKK